MHIFQPVGELAVGFAEIGSQIPVADDFRKDAVPQGSQLDVTGPRDAPGPAASVSRLPLHKLNGVADGALKPIPGAIAHDGAVGFPGIDDEGVKDVVRGQKDPAFLRLSLKRKKHHHHQGTKTPRKAKNREKHFSISDLPRRPWCLGALRRFSIKNNI